jgi:hypothetical protein
MPAAFAAAAFLFSWMADCFPIFLAPLRPVLLCAGRLPCRCWDFFDLGQFEPL